jgi:peptidyl-prolyl cis-trans isomerase A (cyclophilin A)
MTSLLLVLVLSQDLPRIVIETPLGDIEAEIEIKRAPITTANFLKYVDA